MLIYIERERIMDKMTSVKGDSLKYIREYYKVSLAEVYARTKIKVENLMKFESGEDFPSYAQLEKLADYYNKPLFFFFSKDIPRENDIEIAFRKIEEAYGDDSISKQTMELIEKASAYRLNLNELYENENREIFSELVGKCLSHRELKELLREALDLSLAKQMEFARPEMLLEYLRNKFYELGVYVFKDSFKNNSISGLCVYDDEFPIVLLNNKTSFTRQIFTLFHEIYHLYLKEADIDFTEGIEERECNKFASDFLIPEDDLKLQLDLMDDIEDITALNKLANRYNVSRDAIMYRLLKMNLLDKDFYNENKIGYIRDSSSSAGGNFYYTKMSYLGTQYLNKVFSSYYSGKLSKSQVGIYTGLKSVHISKLATRMMGGAL